MARSNAIGGPAVMRYLWPALLAVGTIGCGDSARPPLTPPAPGPEKPKVESELSYTMLSSPARSSLAIQTQKIAPQTTQEHIALTGWIMAPQGHEVTVTAALAGYVRAVAKRSRFPVAGDTVRNAEALMALEPVLAPLEQIQLASLKRGVESELVKARITLTAAETEFKRVRDLHAQGLRGQQELDQGKKHLDHAIEDLKAAQDKQKLFEFADVQIIAPRAGQVLTVHVSPGQYVAAAAPLITVIDLDPVWVRVAVPEFELPLVERGKEVTVQLKSDEKNGKDGANGALVGRFVTQVPQVDAPRHTGDVVYELTATKTRPAFSKNQAVTVHVPLGRQRRETLVPYAAVVYDGVGGSWIYLERPSDQKNEYRYERRRVEVGWSRGGNVAIRPGFTQAENVVTSGAAVLLSREFHRPPVAAGAAPPVEDDD